MCGRYLVDEELYSDMSEMLNSPGLGALSGLGEPLDAMRNPHLVLGEVFPTNIAPVVSADGAKAIKWGFPHWKGAGVIINARAENASEKTMFRKPLAERRCVVPSSGFFEWSHTGGGNGKKKNKYLLSRPGERVLYMAGMIGLFRDANGHAYSAFVILTTSANSSVTPIHDRMPVILDPDERDYWLNDDGFAQYALYRPGPELVLNAQPATRNRTS